MRKIRWRILFLQGLAYRLFAFLVETLILYIYTGRLTFAVSASFGLNILRMLGYYCFHSLFAKTFRLGKSHREIVVDRINEREEKLSHFGFKQKGQG